MADLIDLGTRRRKKAASKAPKRRVGCIIQARMGSTRYPGKVLEPLLGKPVLEHVIERCKLIKTAHNFLVVVATPNLPENEPILELCDRTLTNSFAGSNLNVLERYYECALEHNFDVIIRITADCPFINPIVCEEVLTVFLMSNCDYASNIYPKRTYPRGLDCEVFSMDCLEACWLENQKVYKGINCVDADGKRHHPDRGGGWMISPNSAYYDAEHVTPWMQRHPDIKRVNIEQRTEQDVSMIDYCVDHPGDIERLERLYEKDSAGAPIIWKTTEIPNDKTT